MNKSGMTWWGQRWVAALEGMSLGYSNRLARGRTYARAGRTHDLIVEAGKVTAKVTGSRATPYKVTIALAKLPAAVWDRVIAAMAQKAQFSSELLAGEMPREIDLAFQAAGASVFPSKEADLTTDCSCPDWANPCKHVAATHYVLGEALDRDPFLLFELRGRSKTQVLEALRAARAGDAGQHLGNGAVDGAAEIATVSLGKVKGDDYDRPREPLPSLRLSFETPPICGALLRQLGAPNGWASDRSPAELLGPIARAAAEQARALAMAESEVDSEPALSVAVKRAKPPRLREATQPKQATKKKSANKRASKRPR